MINIKVERCFPLTLITKIDFPPFIRNLSCSKDSISLRPRNKLVKNWIKFCDDDKVKAIEHLNSVIFDRTYNANNRTKEVLFYNREFIQHYLQCGYFRNFLPDYMEENNELYPIKKREYQSKFPGLRRYPPEVIIHDHGLEFLPEKVLEYIKQRDILDIGACVGDSMMVLQKYTDQRIYGYEPNYFNFQELQENIEKWNLNRTKNRYFNLAMGAEVGSKNTEGAGAGAKITDKDEGRSVELTTIDNEVEKRGMKIGLIKADTEGFSWFIFQGGKNKIKEHRPVLCIHLYHNFDEYYNIPEFAREMGNYIFFYRADKNNCNTMGETAFIAYPAEILYPPF